MGRALQKGFESMEVVGRGRKEQSWACLFCLLIFKVPDNWATWLLNLYLLYCIGTWIVWWRVWPWKNFFVNSPSWLGWLFHLFMWGRKDWDLLWPLGFDEPSKTKNSVVPMRRMISEEAGSSGLERNEEPDKERLCPVWPGWFLIAVYNN